MEPKLETLLDYFGEIKDPRRSQGRRHDLKLILLLTLMSTMSGYVGYRAIGDFIKRNTSDLLLILKPHKNRLPSFDVVRQVLINIDFDDFANQFYNWAKGQIKINKNEFVSIDGKAIGGTVTNPNSIDQNFINLVSLYCSRQKLILGCAEVQNCKESEIPIVQNLIKALKIEGVTFTLDALHCQKKQQL